MKRYWTALLLLALLAPLAVACGQLPGGEGATENETTNAAGSAENDGVARPAGWTEETHSNDADPNYDLVFPQDQVNQMTITISPENWEAMQANMIELMGEPGQGGFGGRPPEGFDGQPPEGFSPPAGFDGEPPEGFQPPAGGQFPGRGGGPGDLVSENPMWVEATIEFNGLVWTNVGVRYKGNSSLASAWRSGDDKMPLKLDFDEFEDEYPEIDNQRFYGFKQLSLATNFSDASFMRETVAYDLLEAAGLPAAETAFYEIILDHGDGSQSLGLYTLVEVVDDTVVDRVFGSDDGNIYEGDGPGTTLAEETRGRIEANFQKENNKDEADWSDIEALYEALHDESRLSDPAAWRAELEALFNVPDFLHWLALSAAIQHWDSYGAMSHNFYLYHDPETDQLQWISWDHNQVLGSLPGDRAGEPAQGAPGAPGNRPGGMGQISLDKADVGDDWPLIRFLLDDPVYHEMYIDYLREVATQLDPDALAARYQELAALLQPYAAADIGADSFAAAVQALTDATYQRAQLLEEFLAGE